jgi:arginyl-tRNA synthetase
VQFQADDYVQSVTHDKAFLHFMLKTPSLVRAVLTQVHELTYDTSSGSHEYGSNTSGAGKTVVIE